MNGAAPEQPLPNILVVDDTPANLQLLVGMLKEHGFKVRPVPNGELALRAVRISPPDLILLDISMPEMDGYEVLARLKADEATRDIPVLFISALSETAGKVRAFHAGGVDYVTKPFQFEEVVARVRTHLELRRQKVEIRRSLDQLRELERLRDDLTQMIVHDMRSPLLGLQLTIDLLVTSDLGASAENAEMLETARQAVVALIEMVNQVLDVSRLETGKIELQRTKSDLAGLIRQAVDSIRPLAGKRTILVQAGEFAAEVDPDLIRRVLANLLGNAVKFTAQDGRITISASDSGSTIRVEVRDNGVGIAPGDHQRIFNKFSQVQTASKRRGSGLGLAFAKMAVEAHGGAVGVESSLGAGSTFWFTLPSGGRA
jgi:two-component system sensor histidine kinase/response regulator